MSASTDGERGGEFYPSANDHVNADGAAPVVLVCEHASNYLPTRYRGLGLPKQELSRHIAWDIGAAELTRHLATRLGAIAFLAGASRLLVDCNRPLDSPTLIPEISEIPIPGNRNIDDSERGTLPHMVRAASRGHRGLPGRKKNASAA
jgi:predicted N-formylglutamate amidohydrolase